MKCDNDSVGVSDIVGDGVVYDAGGGAALRLLERERGEKL